MNKKAIIVLGMHRSGTSALAAGLEVLGVALGNKAAWKNKDNPKGFFENEDIVLFNERLLKFLHSRWDNPFFDGQEVIEERNKDLVSWYEEAHRIFQNNFAETPVWGLKDPRMCQLLPFWQLIFKRNGYYSKNIYYIHIARHPVEVAYSQHKRYVCTDDINLKFIGNDLKQTIVLWLSSHYQALRNINSKNNIFILYDNLLNEPELQLDRLIKFLGIERPSSESLQNYCEQFLEKGLKHQNYNKIKPIKQGEAVLLANSVYDQFHMLSLQECFSIKHTKKALELMKKLKIALKLFSSFSAPLADTWYLWQDTEIKYDSLKSEYDSLKSEYDSLKSEYDSLKSEYDSLKSEYYSLSMNYYKLINGLSWKILQKLIKILRVIPGVKILRNIYKKYNQKQVKQHYINSFFNKNLELEKINCMRSDSSSFCHIVFIDYDFPAFDKHAGGRHTWTYLKLLKNNGIAVTFLPNRQFESGYKKYLEKAGIYVPNYPIPNDSVALWSGWIEICKDQIDIIILSRPNVAHQYVHLAKRLYIPTWYFCHDLHFIRLMRQYKIEGRKLDKDYYDLKKIEKDIINRSTCTLTPSSFEKEYIEEKMKNTCVSAIPILLYKKTDLKKSMPASKDILFVGSCEHSPNEMGIIWFIDNVWYKLEEQYKNIKFYIVGENPSEKILKKASSKILILGFVTEKKLKNLYENSKVIIAPLLFGAGVKGKVIEAWANGRPVVGTQCAFEGIPTNKKVYNPTDTSEMFYEKICHYLNMDDYKYNKYIDFAHDFIYKNYSEKVAINIIIPLLKKQGKSI